MREFSDMLHNLKERLQKWQGILILFKNKSLNKTISISVLDTQKKTKSDLL